MLTFMNRRRSPDKEGRRDDGLRWGAEVVMREVVIRGEVMREVVIQRAGNILVQSKELSTCRGSSSNKALEYAKCKKEV